MMGQPPEPPEPPRAPVPPLPPGFKIKAPAGPPPPASIVDWIGRRLEALERELAAERDKAQSAAGMLKAQETLRGEVEAQLSTMREALRREKSERDNEELKSRSAGRVDALEKRLDEMHQTWASLLKDAIARRDAQGPGPELAAMVQRLSADMASAFADMERRWALESERQAAAAQSVAREKAAMQEALEAQHHAIRDERLREQVALETRLAEQAAAVRARLEELKASQDREAARTAEIAESFSKALALTPRAKDEVIANLERENRELMKGLRERSEALRAYALERRQIELSMGASLVDLTKELAAEREKQRLDQARVGGFELEIAKLGDALAAEGRKSADKDERAAALSAERDGLARFLMAESAKVREQLEARAQDAKHWQEKVEVLRRQLAIEVDARLKEAAAASELQNQINALTGQITKAISDKDSLSARYASWEQERQSLLEALRKKEEMVAMLSNTFQNMLGKKLQ